MIDCFHCDHSRLTATQKSLSNRLRAGDRGRRRFSTVNCCRSRKFSKMRSRRLRARYASLIRWRCHFLSED